MRRRRTGGRATSDQRPVSGPARDTPARGDGPERSADTSLTRRTASGIKWNGLSRVLTQLVQFGSIVVLARLLTPEQFGLTAIVITFTSFAMLFTDLGLGAAIVQRPTLEPDDLSTAFWINALSGLSLTLLFAGLAPLFGELYGQPRLVALVLVGSLSFTLSLGVVHNALLERQLKFRALSLVVPTSALLGLGVTVVLALAGLGALSLVIGTVVTTVAKTVWLWSLVRWWPRTRPSRAAARRLWSYSGHLFGFNVINYWARNADNLLIGAVSGAAPLAFYSRAYNLMLVPVQQSTQVVGRVLFPALSNLAGEPERLRRAYLRAVRIMAAITFPLTIGSAAAAPALIDLLLGPRWRPVARLLAILALSGPAQIISGTTGVIYQAVGRTDVLFRRGLVASACTVVAIVIGLSGGALGVAIAVSVNYWLVSVYVTRPAWRLLGLRPVEVLRALRPVALATVALAVLVLAVGRLATHLGHPLQLACQVAAGGVTYALAVRLLAPDLPVEALGVLRPARRSAPSS